METLMIRGDAYTKKKKKSESVCKDLRCEILLIAGEYF